MTESRNSTVGVRVIDLAEEGSLGREPAPSTSRVVTLSTEDAVALRNLTPESDEDRDFLTIQPTIEADQRYELTAGSYVGSITLPSGRVIRVHPKITDAAFIQLLAYSGEPNTQFFKRTIDLREGETFIDSIARQLETEIRDVIRTGLRQSYEPVDETRRSIRGQINLDKQLQRQGPNPISFECTFETHTPNTVLNQLLLAAAEHGGRLTSSQSIRTGLRQLCGNLRQQGVQRRKITQTELDRITLSRLSEHYTDAITLARLIVEGTFASSHSEGDTSARSFMVFQPTIFESAIRKAVKSYYRQRLPTLRVSQIPIGHLVEGAITGETIGNRIIPDIVLQSDDEILGVFEIKWSATGPSQTHLYQLVSYLSVANIDVGVLIYPTLKGVDETEYSTPDGKTIHLLEVKEVLTGSPERSVEEFGSQLEAHLGRQIPYDISSLSKSLLHT